MCHRRQPLRRIESSLTGHQGFISRELSVIVVSLVLLGVLSAGLWQRSPSPTPKSSAESKSLFVYCAASNKDVFQAIRADYERDSGVKLDVQYGASQALLASIQLSGTGDLFLPADDSYLTLARERQLLAEEYPLAMMQGVVAVAKGNPKKIQRFADLLRDDVRVAQANPDSAAIGKMTRDVLTAAKQWDELHAHTLVYKTTVNEVANDVKVGSADVGIVFDAVLHTYDTLEAVAIPELADVTAQVAVATLQSSQQLEQARHLARYLSAENKGLARYREFGFQPVDGDSWTEQPEITLYSGSMLRPAIEKTIVDFEKREGVRVTRVYNGCGILVAQMKAGQVPDAYFACDMEFMNQVRDLFPNSEDVSQNELVILVKKGNPLGIKTLKDLTREGLRVGVGHEKQCAMGWLTQRTFDEGGVKTEIMKNVVVQTPTGDMLVNQMRTGSLDAAVAYLSNATGAAEFLDAIRIQGIPCSVATQPFGVAKDSSHKQLVERLRQALRAESSKSRFTNEGFQWVPERSAANE